MVDFPINTGVRKIAVKILVPVPKGIDEEWFAEDIIPLLSNDNVLGTLVFDFAYDVPTVIQYTLDSGANWISFNNGAIIDGGQSRFVDVTTGVQVNVRSNTAGNLIRAMVSSVP